MKKTFNIWIPSIQNFLRFSELTSDQYLIILKSLDDNDIDFSFTLNQIIKNNLFTTFDHTTLTTLDRFIIFLALKINSCGSTLTLSSNCSECSSVSTVKMDLNILVDNLGQRIDKSFKEQIIIEPFTVFCDLPSIEQDYKIMEYGAWKNVAKTSTDFILNNYVISHVKQLKIHSQMINTNDLPYEEQIQIINMIPAKVMDNVRKLFLNGLHSLVSDFDFLRVKCSNKKCSAEMEVKFDINNINDIIRIIYRDSSYLTFLSEMIIVTEGTYLGGDFVSKICPIDVRRLAQQLSTSRNSSNEQSPKENDLFDEYVKQNDGLVESPSEFQN